MPLSRDLQDMLDRHEAIARTEAARLIVAGIPTEDLDIVRRALYTYSRSITGQIAQLNDHFGTMSKEELEALKGAKRRALTLAYRLDVACHPRREK